MYLLFLFYVYERFAFMYVHGGQKRARDTLQLILKIEDSCPVGVRNQIQLLCKSRAASAFNNGVISSAPKINFFIIISNCMIIQIYMRSHKICDELTCHHLFLSSTNLNSDEHRNVASVECFTGL